MRVFRKTGRKTGENAARPRRLGSALVIVLGLLAVLMLMAMAFSVSMRTERSGASNKRHATLARQLLDTALARTMADLDAELGTKPAPNWGVYVSTANSAEADHFPSWVLSYEAARHIAPDKLALLRKNNPGPGWVPIRADAGSGGAVVGRFSYAVINDNGLFNANLIEYGEKPDERKLGVSPEEVDMRILSDVDTFMGVDGIKAALGALKRPFESMGELQRVMADGDDLPGSIKLRNFMVAPTSYALEGFSAHQGGASSTIKPKVPLDETKLNKIFSQGALDAESQAYLEQIRKAMEDAFTGNDPAVKTLRPPMGAQVAEIDASHIATAALLDYMDGDDVPGGNKAGASYYPSGPAVAFNSGRVPNTESVPSFETILVQLEDAEWGLPAPGPANNKRNVLNFGLRLQTVYLGVANPDQNKNYTVSAKVDAANSSAPVIGTANLNNWISSFNSQLSSYTHEIPTYVTADILLRRAPEKAKYYGKNAALEFIGAMEDLPNEIPIHLSIDADIKNSDGRIVQQVKGLMLTLRVPKGKTVPSATLGGITYKIPEPAGWAHTMDPRFGAFTDYWLTSGSIRENLSATLWEEMGMPTYEGFPNPLCYHILNSSEVQFTKNLDTLTGIIPDHFLSGVNGISWNDKPETSVLNYVRNGFPESIGELGALIAAPLKTVALYDHRVRDKFYQRHKVLDHFTLSAPRSDGTGAAPDDVYKSAVLAGRLNLNANATNIVFSAGDTNKLDYAYNSRNAEPLAALLTGVPLNEFGSTPANQKKLSEPEARVFANAFYRYNMARTNDTSSTGLNKDGMAYDLSVLGRSFDDSGESWATMLATEVSKKPASDFEREGIIRNTVGLLTTRQQFFTILLRADAFSPKFGFDNVGEGTTLSSAHAVAQVWRDPEPMRDKDGKVIEAANGASVHPWVLLYLHQF